MVAYAGGTRHRSLSMTLRPSAGIVRSPPFAARSFRSTKHALAGAREPQAPVRAARDAVASLGVCQFDAVGFEVNDLLALWPFRLSTCTSVTIVSTDKDLLSR